MYLAMIGDLVASREHKRAERYAIQEKLEHVLHDINQTYRREIVSSFLITLGNEFQGLLKKPDHLFEICERIITALQDQTVRFGLGCGEIHTKINQQSIGADGPAFHNARDALDVINAQKDRKESLPMTWHYISHQRTQDLTNSILMHMSFQRQKWTQRQRDIIHEMLRTQSQIETARNFAITQPYVHKVLKGNGYYVYLNSRQVVTETLRRDMRV